MVGDETIITLEMLPDHFSLSPQITLGGYAGLHENRRPAALNDHGLQELTDLKDREKNLVAKALSLTGGNVARAARTLGISRQLLAYKIKKHQLSGGRLKK